MDQISELIKANRVYAADYPGDLAAPPSRHLAVVTCMDARIDVAAAFSLGLGEAHVIRNAGGRITDDVLRSLALSVNILGINAVVVVQHTQCGLENISNEELITKTGANIDFLPIYDHTSSLKQDIQKLLTTPYLQSVKTFAGFIFEVESGHIRQVDIETR